MAQFLQKAETRLFIWLSAIFICNVFLAEFLGVKIFSLERTLGLEPLSLSLFGVENLSFNLTTGVVIWPVVFILTDVINEYYGPKGVRFISFLSTGLILFGFFVVYIAIHLVPADFWPQSHFVEGPGMDHEAGVTDLNIAYKLIFGQGLWIIIGSLTAFMIGQFLDVFVFHAIKRQTGENSIWIRATGSTLISQLIDSYIVLLIAFHIGSGWPLNQVLAIGTMNYVYKFVIAICSTPFLYFIHYIIEKYLGNSLAQELKKQAMNSSEL